MFSRFLSTRFCGVLPVFFIRCQMEPYRRRESLICLSQTVACKAERAPVQENRDLAGCSVLPKIGKCFPDISCALTFALCACEDFRMIRLRYTEIKITPQLRHRSVIMRMHNSGFRFIADGIAMLQRCARENHIFIKDRRLRKTSELIKDLFPVHRADIRAEVRPDAQPREILLRFNRAYATAIFSSSQRPPASAGRSSSSAGTASCVIMQTKSAPEHLCIPRFLVPA